MGAPVLARENASFSAALSLGGVSKVCPRTVPKQQRKLNSLLTAFAWVVVAMVDCVPVPKNDFSWFSDVRMIGAPKGSGGVLKKNQGLETKEHFYVLLNLVAY